MTAQDWMIEHSATASKTRGEYIGPTLGTYNILATTDQLGVKIDGGSTIATVLTAGATQTATQVVANLNGNGSLTAVATIDVYLGRVRITSKTKGATSSVQIDTAQTESAHNHFGFDGVVRSGRDNAPILEHFFNSRTSVYS